MNDTKDDWKLLLIIQGFRTLNVAFICGALVGISWAAAWCVRGVYGGEHTFWSVAAIVATGLFGSSPLTIAVAVYLKKRFQRYIARHQDHTIAVEQACDPGRSTSGLLKDGSHPHDI